MTSNISNLFKRRNTDTDLISVSRWSETLGISTTPIEIIGSNYTNPGTLITPNTKHCSRPNLPQLFSKGTELIGVGAWCATLDISTYPPRVGDSDCMDFKIPIIQTVKNHIDSNLSTTDHTWDCIQVYRQTNIEADSHDASGGLRQPTLHQDLKRSDAMQLWASGNDKESPWLAIGPIVPANSSNQ
ncbi:hypothetical protein EG329_006777 [Mollisiaceae sp. DMI_Dod_QoI]|nr:hypothetical protein EG329_006777 [Helotiales sp. DMI_Dod_QoI]